MMVEDTATQSQAPLDQDAQTIDIVEDTQVPQDDPLFSFTGRL